MSYRDHSAYILRGNKLGIYRRSSSSEKSSLHFSSSTCLDQPMSRSQTTAARQAMLYRDESSYLVLKQDHHVTHFDIEYGKIVDEWRINDGADPCKYENELKYQISTPIITYLLLKKTCLIYM